MNPFRKLAAESKGEKEPVYCSVPECKTYVGRGQYVRSFAHVCFTKPNGERVQLCGYHYLVGLDVSGKSVKAQLRADPESIVSQVEAQTKASRDV